MKGWVRHIWLMTSCFAMQTGAVLIPFFQQFTGINTIMFYATELFDVLGDGANSALLNTAIVGAVNVGSTIPEGRLVWRRCNHWGCCAC